MVVARETRCEETYTMLTTTLSGPLTFPNIRDGLHAYALTEHLPPETELHVLSDLLDALWREAASRGITWHVGMSTADAHDECSIARELTDVLDTVDVHRIVDPYLMHPHYPRRALGPAC